MQTMQTMKTLKGKCCLYLGFYVPCFFLILHPKFKIIQLSWYTYSKHNKS